jgi:hypothetical protein
MTPFLALITPVAAPAGPPLGTWGGAGEPFPTPPIAGPGRPPWWGMAQDPGYGVPGTPKPPPLVIWGPGDPRPTLPIAGWDPGSGAFPTPKPPQPPLGIWGGANEPFPTPPIAEPPWGWGNAPPKPTQPPATDLGPVDWKYAWTPSTGWVVIGIPTGPIPTPSATAAPPKK